MTDQGPEEAYPQAPDSRRLPTGAMHGRGYRIGIQLPPASPWGRVICGQSQVRPAGTRASAQQVSCPPFFVFQGSMVSIETGRTRSEEDTEAGIHGRVQGTGRQARPGGGHRGGRQGVGADRADAAQLGEGGSCRQARGSRRQAGYARTDGTVAAARGVRAAEAARRHPKKSDGVLLRCDAL